MVEILALGGLFLLTSGVAVYMMIRSNKTEVVVKLDEEVLEKVTSKIVESLERALKGLALRTQTSHMTQQTEDEILLDESIIPIDVNISDITESSIKQQITEELDNSLDKDRSKLAQMLGKKK